SAGAILRSPSAFRNPGVYSYDLKKDGIAASGYVKKLEVLGRGSGPASWIYQKRQALGRIMDNGLSAENASFHKALVPGLKKGISIGMREAFSATGLAHLLSISGTHFGLLAFIIYNLARLTLTYMPVRLLTRMTLYITPSQIAVVVTLPVLVMYALVSGMGNPTVRSLIMVTIYMLSLLLGRKGQWLNSLAIAALVILLWQPGALFEVSFQLSFLAVLFIGLILEKRNSIEDEGPEYKLPASSDASPVSPIMKGRMLMLNKVKTAVLITLAAVIGTAPVSGLLFRQFSLISPITNLVVTPLVCFIILPLGFFTGFCALILDLPSLPLSGLTDTATHLVLKLIRLFSDVPYAGIHIHGPSIAMVALYYLSLLFLLKGFRPLRLLLFLFVCGWYMLSPYIAGHNMKVTFLDVGQADASVVELPDGKTMLIDGGTLMPDAGRMAVAPFLWSEGIRRIDYLVISHFHPDHFGGLFYILDNFEISEIWTSGRAVDEAEGIISRVREKRIPYRIISRGDALETAAYSIRALHPYKEFYADSPRGEFSDQNSDSLVLKLASNAGSILFTGDIEEDSEDDLIHLGDLLRSDIIKVAHHGGRTSGTEAFIAAVRPETAVISAGRNNQYGHPHKETLGRYRKAGSRIFRTDVSGAVTVEFRGNSYDVKTYEDSALKRVTHIRDEIMNLGLLF
ncbi:MAG: DNA internalization-related competence protein ComEC/Rec2, partial [Nitrospirota bacterium]|nr:DNA internalization-related competence protein ComEC/Rec2 [Nitrospirota bacterium]